MILIYYYIETNIKSDLGFKILINSHKKKYKIKEIQKLSLIFSEVILKL